jgi:predicted phosphodiesterase
MKIAIVSDIHLGDAASQICARDPQTGQAVIGPKYAEFANAAGKGNNYLILLGDILDFSIQNYRDTYEVAKTFFRQVKKDDIAEKLLYVPGNHDIDVWHSVEYQVNIINRIRKNKEIEYFRHSVPGVIIDQPDNLNRDLILAGVSPRIIEGKRVYGGLFLDYLVQSTTEKSELTFYFAYPNLWLVTDEGESVLITHGHYFETYYALAGELAVKLAPSDFIPNEYLTLKEMVGVNFPLTQFACSGIGQAGPLTNIIARVQREVKDGRLSSIKGHLSQLPKALAQIFEILCWKKLVLRIGIGLAKWPLLNELRQYKGARFEEEFMNDEKNRERFRRFYRSSLRELDELRKNSTVEVDIPPPKIVIYGHTHNPFSWGSIEPKPMTVDGITVKLYNTGGWLTKKEDNIQKFVGAEVFIYETGRGLSSVSIRE